MNKTETNKEIIYTNDFSKENFKINLLPNRLHYISLARNLPKTAWNKFRRKHIDMKNGTCELCGLKMNSYHNCHEIFEVYDNVINLVDIKVLCNKCHMTQHVGFVLIGKAQISMDELEEHYEKVSGRNFNVEYKKAIDEYKIANEKLKDKEFKFELDENLLGRSIIEEYIDIIDKSI